MHSDWDIDDISFRNGGLNLHNGGIAQRSQSAIIHTSEV